MARTTKKTTPKTIATKTTIAKTTPKVEKVSNKDMMPKIKVMGVGGSGKNVIN